MSVAKVLEVIASSPTSFEAAVNEGLARVNDSMTDVTGAWIKDQRVVVSNGKVTDYRVIMKVTFVLRPVADENRTANSAPAKVAKKR